MLSFRRRARRGAYFILAWLILNIARLLPRDIGMGFGVGLARLAARIRSRDLDLARANLAIAFPGLTADQREGLLAGAMDDMGRNLFDTLIVGRWRRRDFVGVEDDGTLAELDELRARGRGVLILTGHIGCWELLGARLARGLGELAVVTGTIRNAPVDRAVNDWRRRSGLLTLPRDGDQRPLLRHLQSGGVVAVLLDQNTRVSNLPVPFFGRPAPTPSGAAKLALRYGIPILPVVIRRTGEGHRLVHLPVIEPDDHRGDLPGLLAACNSALEEMIRRNPREWVWFHRRWQ